MSRRSRGWSGSTVTRARRYWGYRIAAAAASGTALLCSHCKTPVLPTDAWDVDHLIPRHDGGRVRDITNQWPSHSSCNRAAGQAMTMDIKRRQVTRVWGWR